MDLREREIDKLWGAAEEEESMSKSLGLSQAYYCKEKAGS